MASQAYGLYLSNNKDNNEEAVSDYDKYYVEIESALNNMKTVNIDITDFKDRLDEINNDLNIALNQLSVKLSDNASYIISSIYNNSINELKSLKKEILEYDAYVRTYNTCVSVLETISSDIKDININSLIEDVIKSLVGLSCCKHLSKEKHIQIYEIVYNIIKYEIIRTGDSVLCKNILNNDSNIIYLSNAIEKNLDIFKDNALISKKLNQIRTNGLFCNYVDIELIKLMLISEDSKYKSVILDRINKGITNVNNCDSEMLQKVSRVSSSSDSYIYARDRVKEGKKKLRKRGISLGLVSALFITAGVGLEKSLHNSNTCDIYDKTEVHMLSNGETESIDKTKVYEKDFNISRTEEQILYNNGRTETVIATYDYVGKGVPEDYTAKNIIFYVFLCFLAITITHSWIVDYVDTFKTIIRRVKEEKIEKTTLIKELNELYDIIQKDTNAREAFERFYEENKYLIYDEEELFKRIEDLLNNSARTITAERAKKLYLDFHNK